MLEMMLVSWCLVIYVTAFIGGTCFQQHMLA
jgi:hypothetical protein